VIVEYIRYRVPEERAEEFEQAYAAAAKVLHTSPHCSGYELSRCVEEPTSYIVRIDWDSMDGHLEGFRKSAEFPTFFAAVRPFFQAIEEMHHYEPRS
jgi:heme-degrading monooxygenase HmoA